MHMLNGKQGGGGLGKKKGQRRRDVFRNVVGQNEESWALSDARGGGSKMGVGFVKKKMVPYFWAPDESNCRKKKTFQGSKREIAGGCWGGVGGCGGCMNKNKIGWGLLDKVHEERGGDRGYGMHPERRGSGSSNGVT